MRSGLDYSRQHRAVYAEIVTSHELAVVEAEYGDLHRGLTSSTSPSNPGSGPVTCTTFRSGWPAWPCASHGCSSTKSQPSSTAEAPDCSSAPPVAGLPHTVQQLRGSLGATMFDRRVATGTAMETGDAVAYARQQIHLVRESNQPPV